MHHILQWTRLPLSTSREAASVEPTTTALRRSRTGEATDWSVGRLVFALMLGVLVATALLWAAPARAANGHGTVVKASHHAPRDGALPIRRHKRTARHSNKRGQRLVSTCTTPGADLPVTGRVLVQHSPPLDAAARRPGEARAPPAVSHRS